MRLYLSGESKNGVGYIPDWLKVSYKKDGQSFELTLDIQGETDYDNKTLDCRCKGNLIPWILYDFETEDKIDLSELDEEDVKEMFPVEKLVEILRNGSDYKVGIFPGSDEKMELAEKDVVSNCKGHLKMYDGEKGYAVDFEFDAELNIN